MHYSELVKTIWFDRIDKNDLSWQFKAEIWQKSPHEFWVEMWELQYFRVQPSFEPDDMRADDEFFRRVTWQFDVDKQIYSSTELAVKAACHSLKTLFLLD